MSFADTITTDLGGSSIKRDLALWGSAALIVLAAHAGGGWYLSQAMEVEQQPAAVEEAMLVDLTPMLETTPDAVESETLTEEEPTEMAAAEEPVEATAPDAQEVVTPDEQTPVTEETSPEQTVAEETTPVEPEPVEPTVVEPEQVEPEEIGPEIEEIQPEAAEPEPVEPDVVTEEIIEEPTVTLPDSDVPLPVTRPEPREIVRETPPPARRQPPREQTREQPRREEPRQPQQARPQPRSEASTQQRASSAPTIAPARWNAQVSRLVQRSAQRAIRRIRGTGQVTIAFTVGASGAVSNVRVARSSGNTEIDAAVVNAVRGISAPPAPGGSQSVTIPVLKSR
jgi:protein TonB